MLTINLTTTCQRLGLCRIALVSLSLQSRLPDHINVWVSREPYLRDSGIADPSILDQLLESLPDTMRGKISFRWVKNIGPYRKLVPVLREAGPDDIFVTADDDIFYGKDWLRKLLEAVDPAAGVAVAARVKSKRFNSLERKTSYLYWHLIEEPLVVSSDYIVTFGGGAVLTKAMFHDQDIIDDSFMEVAPTADDLWYSMLLRRKETRVQVVPGVLGELNFILHKDGLKNHNFPVATSLLHKVKIRFWNRYVGYWGVPVCGNDRSYRRIDQHFLGKRI